ncbi:MAG: SDR family NAD(P)-dependent oxidoreductase [Chitinophagaceae bacterium]|nr:SDR family NAD(P)-dependent oxidoreductase [Chitinophagaceae bacterium]
MAYALVTGAAKGIGKSIAHELTLRNYNLLLVDVDGRGLALTKLELERTAGVHVAYLVGDLSLPETPEAVFKWSSAWQDELEVLVNNAAFGLNGAFAALPLQEQLSIIDVNIKSVVALSHRFIPVLKKRGRGYILNIGSNAGYQPVPYLNIYAASKAFIISFTRSLRHELRSSGIVVSCVSPGSTDTHFVDRAGMGNHIRKTAERYNMTPRAVAKIAVNTLFKGNAERITGFQTKLGVFLSWLAPKSWAEKFGANIFGREIQISK